MHRRILYFLMIVTLCCTLFAGCGGDKQPVGTTGNESTTQVTETQDTTEQNDATLATETDATVPYGYVLTYSDYMNLTPAQQKEIIKQFESKEAFERWLAEIRLDYEKYMTSIQPSQSVDPTESSRPIIPTPSGVTVPDKDEVTFMDYHEMTGDEQLAFINSFSSPSAFAAWHAAARDAYNETMIEIDDTKPIDGSELIDKIGKK